MVTVVLLPVKDPERSKQRLAGLLSPGERTQLVWAMLEDVCAAVRGCRLADRVVVVARDPEVAAYAVGNGWEVFRETGQVSESRSVDWASRLLQEQGAEAVLRLPVDVPLVQAGDLDALLDPAARGPEAVLVPSQDGLGTNALLRSPPLMFPSRFGADSLQKHLREARLREGRVLVRRMPRLALDLDLASDLLRFHGLGKGTATHALLQRLAVGERLAGLKRGAHAGS
ncbi:MAG: 2-phospho-L-lactate guanylyltransferase [Acidobacteria bacterium]|nr:2-phospho-L-lactate guanylyltransferase [Acidobacteriota bacterium]